MKSKDSGNKLGDEEAGGAKEDDSFSSFSIQGKEK